MAKTIKFNLILDDYPVRNLEGLQEHFAIEDMLKYFENGLLLRWLKVREYTKQYDAVNAIEKTKNKKAIITELIKIFEIPIEDTEIEKAIGILNYLDEEKKLNAIYEKNAFERNQIINDYHSGYDDIIDDMEQNPNDMSMLKAAAFELEKKYLSLFMLDYNKLYFRLKDTAPKAIFAILTRDNLRRYWLEFDKSIYDNIKEDFLFIRYVNSLDVLKLSKILDNDLKIVKKDTKAMWDQIEPPEVEVMVLGINDGAFVKNAGKFGEKLGVEDINGKFVKLKGLEYQCNWDSYELLYMEV